MKRFFKSAAFPILLVVILAFVAQKWINTGPKTEAPSYNELVKPEKGLIASGRVEEVTINTKDNTLDVKETGGDSFSTGYPPNTEQSLVNLLDRNNVKTTVKGTGGSSLLSLLTYILPFVLFFGFWIFLMNQMQGGGSRVMNFGKSKAKRMSVDAPIEGRHVLIVEDIIDSGLTLQYLMRNLNARSPASLEVAALLRKEGIQKVPLDLRYVGFDIPNEFVVGYGLDYGEFYRNLRFVGVLRPEVYGGGD